MIERLEVQLVTPAMIGGATSRECDKPLTLRVPELRGMFRFWTRALGGAAFRTLEEELWGSTRVGQRVTLRTIPVPGGTPSARPPGTFLFPHKRGAARTATDMINIGARLKLQFNVPTIDVTHGGRTEPLRVFLRAVVWTALHLGAVGRRSRRGYGSLQWVPTPQQGDLLTDFVEGGFDPGSDLASAVSLEAYLQRGLTKVCSILGSPAAGPPPAGRASSDWFQLQHVDQVFIGRQLTAAYNGRAAGDMEDIIHGCGPYNGRSIDLAERSQLGRALPADGGRLASPMLWHIFQLQGRDYVPVMTWSPRDGVTSLTQGTGMYAYLTQRLGFANSLAGRAL